MKLLNRIPFELIFWITALVLLWTANPALEHDVHHFTLCPLANMGFDWCPGCGLGRSITQFLHGNVRASLAQHWFGIPALMIIFHRIVELVNRRIIENRKLKYKEERYV